jgi:thymidylate kinase
MRGKFITLEGIDGAGKSTHAPHVRDLVAAHSGPAQ